MYHVSAQGIDERMIHLDDDDDDDDDFHSNNNSLVLQ